MKRDGSIASLFQKHIAKKLAASSSSPSPIPAATVVEEQIQEQERIIEEDVNPSLVASSVLSESIETEDDILPPIPAPIPPSTEDVLPPQSPIYDSIAFLVIQLKGSPLQVILLMIKMQLEGHIFLMVHTNLIHMNLRKEQLEVESGVSIVYSFTNMIGLNIVSKRKLCFASYATCSSTNKVRQGDRCIYSKGLEQLEYRREITSETYGFYCTQGSSREIYWLYES